MKTDGSDTVPGFHHPRRSSRPPRDVAELPEPLHETPLKTLYQYVAELHHDMRSLRNEFTAKQDASRDAIWRLQSTVEGLRTAQDYAFAQLREYQRKDRRAIAVLVFCIFAFVVARSYRWVGV
jgi:hypothetical protein